MGFMKGAGAVRRTADYLAKGIILKPSIKVFAVHYNRGRLFEHHKGLADFVFWHLPQIRYKNASVHVITFQKITPTPWIKAYLEDQKEVVIDCDSRSRAEIYEHVKNIFERPKTLITTEGVEFSQANFGDRCDRQCICEVPGQIHCGGWGEIPVEKRFDYEARRLQEASESE